MDNRALQRVENNAQLSPLADVQIDRRLAQVAKAIQLMAGLDASGNPNVSDNMAIAAAMYQLGTGQQLGVDFYVNDKLGRIDGYRGKQKNASTRGVGNLQVDYRPLRVEEAEENEVRPGDTAIICEISQLDVWAQARKMGVPYRPIVGIGIIRRHEKYVTIEWVKGQRYPNRLPEDKWKPIQLEGGYTWNRKARNRAYKDALDHTPGARATVAEVLTDAYNDGLDVEFPEGFTPTAEQAQAFADAARMVAEAKAGPDPEVQRAIAGRMQQRMADDHAFDDPPADGEFRQVRAGCLRLARRRRRTGAPGRPARRALD